MARRRNAPGVIFKDRGVVANGYPTGGPSGGLGGCCQVYRARTGYGGRRARFPECASRGHARTNEEDPRRRPAVCVRRPGWGCGRESSRYWEEPLSGASPGSEKRGEEERRRRIGLEESRMSCRYAAPRSSSGGSHWGCGLTPLLGWGHPPHHLARSWTGDLDAE